MLRLDKLTESEKDDLLRWFMHHLEPGPRGKLMVTFPLHYNKICGRDIVAVYKTAEVLATGASLKFDGKEYRAGEMVPAHQISEPLEED